MEIPKTKTTMRQEIISDKAQDYVSRLYAENEYPCGLSDIESDVMEAFIDGAQWRINAAWHTELKEAQTRMQFLVEFTNGRIGLFDDIRCLKGIEDLVLRYAYVDDLIPDRKEGER